MRTFWSKPRSAPVKFVYITADPTQASEVKRLAGPEFLLEVAVSSLDSALQAAEKSGACVVLTDAELPGFTWRDVVAVSRECDPAPAVVVILDSFESAEWADIMRTRAYDVLLRPLRRESLAAILAGAYASATGVRKSPN
jgi:DNA-binding NtrC family response regulator